ncbi:unnamed protein product (macronuclear) [Paramecium tetraurelia]|uniref:Phosphoribulokinase/uridine kinase domain-containing protein n=1 Tax=Paramecium tetraurelia TaxID=5888 RepID=A0DR94_PARTE|nr:uncharacterized protein GSPATT00019278001 [Paramecium tetraurelia]CAK85561.1 unnamed protein product [Paramecium tetraurelia]|eukprot:XP_001452958.1 hypothetical protein (macronuclear) [Paramecium tetraurelia strain d4-2]
MILNHKEDKQIIIAIAGVPGSGKTYFCKNVICLQYPDAKVIPMDGYHIYRKDLNEEGIKRRGAAFTFDYQRFKADLTNLRETGTGSFPDFQHSIKDPVENAIHITKEDKIIVVEGLYLFLKEWDLKHLFDQKFFINKEFNAQLIGQRHYVCGIEDTLEKGIQRAIENDKVNAEYILQNSDFSDVTYIK